MRATGEKRFQPSGKGEVAAFTAVNMIKQNEKMKAGFEEMSEDERNAFMEEIVRRMDWKVMHID